MYQKITVIGNLGSDPEMRYLPDGTAVTNLSLAANRKWTDQATGQAKTETTWFRVSVWGRRAEVANEYLASGRLIMVEGRLKPDPHTGGPNLFTRRDGTVGASYEIVADEVKFLGGGNGENGNGRAAANGVPVGADGYDEADDIPF